MNNIRSETQQDRPALLGWDTLPCTRCLHNAGWESGMAGSEPCNLLEKASSSGVMPAEWLSGPHDTWRCSLFLSVWEFEEQT